MELKMRLLVRRIFFAGEVCAGDWRAAFFMPRA